MERIASSPAASTKSKMVYRSVEAQPSFPVQEEQILAFWQEKDIFNRSIEARRGADEYVCYDGPPFATGLPHFGHFVPGTVKDIFPRYHTMCGKRVTRRFGWDCHGVPVEHEVEKELGISGKAEIERYGVANFNEKCRSIVLRYTREWQETVTRMGRWVDFDNDYKTMDPSYMESIWWVFKQLWERGYIYHGYYILPYSPGLATPLSNFEVNLGGYHEVDDPALTVRFRLQSTAEQSRGALSLPAGTAILAWTTTPWTLPSNLGLAVGEEIDYALVSDKGGNWIVAAELVDRHWRAGDAHTVERHFTGRDLVGLQYEPLFPYFANLEQQGAFRVHAAAFVTTDEGTGIVHLAPAFGEDDYQVFRDSGLPIEMPLDEECRFTDRIPEYSGLFVKDADKQIIKALKEMGAVMRHEQHRHSYPFCWRTKRPLIYRAVDSWFVRIEQIKKRMLAANEQMAWMPAHIQHGRFGRWLESARDWAISRSRYWGNPIPIWRSPSGYTECIGSIAELEAKSGQRVTDLHKHYVDELTWEAADGSGLMRRIPEVLDCWFESGAMPYAQSHYPFENRDHFEQHYPADFICEGVDQTRGWFYTLTVLAAALFDRPPARNVIVSGLVLDANGRKMSKSERNYSDPRKIIATYGADALRLFLMRSVVVRAEDLKYSDDGVREVLRQIIIPLWSAYSFFVTYANIDGIRPDGTLPTIEDSDSDEPTMLDQHFDAWLLSECQRLISLTRARMDAYDLQQATEPIIEFIDHLNNWYIRRNRRRFWSGTVDENKRNAYRTLHHALMTLITVAAPFIPFITEAIYHNLRDTTDPESIHLCDYPTPRTQLGNKALERQMRVCLQAVRMGRTLRKNHSLKNRQPLSTLYLVSSDPAERAILLGMRAVIADELNIKQVIVSDNERDYVEYSAKANFQLLGRQLGSGMRTAAAQIANLTDDDISTLLAGRTVQIEVDGTPLPLTTESVQIIRNAKGSLQVLNNGGSLTTIIDPEITVELRNEGLMRDIIRLIQRSRKDGGFEISDTISISYATDDHIQKIVARFRNLIMRETLTLDLQRVSTLDPSNNTPRQKYTISEHIDQSALSLLLRLPHP